ncbi:MAG: hypothetical protein JWN46_988 [Acidimicrobiales bacterium]|nr:hypothetical protein [Acidimicrobiales bacterium]
MSETMHATHERRSDLLERLAKARSGRLPGWTLEVVDRILAIDERLDHVEPRGRANVLALLEATADLVIEPIPWHVIRARLSDWWNGTRVERAWIYLHQAELQVVEHATSRGLVLARDEAAMRAAELDPDNPARVRLEHMIGPGHRPEK